MILRKPYAFLIKNFKLIHFFMMVLAFYVVFKTWNVLSFFNEYIDASQILSTFENLASKYTNFLFVFCILSIIAASSIILFLLRHKKKPYKFYIFCSITYILLAILVLISSSFLSDITFVTPDLRLTKAIRDIYLAFLIIQIPIIAFLFVRTIGFDIKKFDFNKDILEFELTDEDNEEFEVDLGIDKETVRTKARKQIRYFKYYYAENRIAFIGIFALILIVLFSFAVRFITSIEKIYKENETFKTKLLEITVLDSYKTKYDSKGNLISGKNFYLITKLRYKNNSSSDFEINTDNARVNYTDILSSAPSKLYYDKFMEFGVPYYNQTIHSNETRDFILVYEIPNEYYNNKKYQLKYLYDISNDNGETNYKYRKVNLRPTEYLDSYDDNTVEVKNLGEELTFKDSVLGNTKITINSIDIKDKFSYNLIRCKEGSCTTNKDFLIASSNKEYELTLMLINYNLTYDLDTIGKGYSINDFISRFGSIRFVINDKTYESKIDLNDITPYPTNGYAYIEVRDKLKLAEKIYLDFDIRDKRYTYVIKDDTKEKENVEKGTTSQEK